MHTKFETSSFYSSWEIFDEKFNIGLYRQKEKNERTNKPRKPIVFYTIQFIITALHTKFEASSFYSSWEIFDEKFNIGLYGEKEEWKNK